LYHFFVVSSIAYIAPSITTDSANLGFRIYTLDGDYSGSSYVSYQAWSVLVRYSLSTVFGWSRSIFDFQQNTNSEG